MFLSGQRIKYFGYKIVSTRAGVFSIRGVFLGSIHDNVRIYNTSSLHIGKSIFSEVMEVERSDRTSTLFLTHLQVLL